MGSEVIIFPVIFLVIFGMFYLYITARNRERLALIDKGAEASIFYSKKKYITPVWAIVVVNLALLLSGSGIGICLANLLAMNLGLHNDVAFPGTIFLMAGIGLFAGFFITKKLTKTI